jgi:TP901 family phage tail tape measure protein
MANLNSTATFKADISNLRSQMQAAAREVRLANSEFKKATAGMDDWSHSADGLEAKIKQLNKVIDSQKKQVEIARKELEKIKKEYGENSAEAERAQISLNKYEAALASSEKELTQYGKELEKAEKYGDGFNDALDEMDDAAQKASDGFSVMKGALASLVADGIRLAIDGIKELATETFRVGASFEQEMAKVAAISGADAEAVDKLNAKAKEMGETTVFSASEAASAFEYMAMAGWDTEDMLSGIEGVMSLAAASGEDLATTSDIVTDALTAMGYSAGDAGKLADVMAAASSSANTNVGLMGSTFKYAAPLIGAMGYSMEDAAVAIGLMANAGIKGEKSGTALRTILTNLSAPTDRVQKAMDRLGISLTDEAGNMRSLDDVMKDLRTGFKDLSETEKTQVAADLAGKEAMSGLLAVVNAAPADYEKLTKAVNNSTGASKEMADTMNDTVNGQVTLLKSKVEGVMIKIFENASGAIREAIQQISDALDKVDWDAFGKKVGDIVKKVVDFFGKLLKNSKQIIDTLKVVGKTLIAVFVVQKLTAFITGIIKTVQVIKTLKDALSLAATSSTLLSTAMSALPWVAAAAGVAALVSGIVILANKSDEYKEIVADLTDEEQKNIDKVHELAQAYADMKEARDDSVKQVEAEFNHYEELKQELDSLVGANGKVKEGYEDRVAFILGELNSALGTEMQMTDGVIENYTKQRQELDNLIDKKRAMAVLSANEEAYTEALQKEGEAQLATARAMSTYNDTLDRMNAAQEERDRLMQISAKDYAEEIGMTDDLFVANQKLEQAQKAANETYQKEALAHKTATDSLREAQSAYIGYETQIRNFEKLAGIIESGEGDINEALMNLTQDFVDAEHGNKESLERQVSDAEASLKAIEEAYELGMTGITTDTVNQYKDLVKRSKTELDKFVKQNETAGANSQKKYAQGIRNNQGEVISAAKDTSDKAVAELDTGASKAESKGESWTTAFARGLSSKLGEVQNAVASLNSSASDLGNVDTYTSGTNFMNGFINGINDRLAPAKEAVANSVRSMLDTLKKTQKEGSPSKITMQSGIYFGQGYINGIRSTLKQAQSIASELAESAIKPLNMTPNINGIRSAVNSAYGANTGGAVNTSNVTNNYNLVQNNSSPKPLTALDTYRARRQQIAMIKAATT